jgi:hypothetical protein
MSKQVKNTVRIVMSKRHQMQGDICREMLSTVTYCIGTLIYCDNEPVFTSETKIEGLVVQR